MRIKKLAGDFIHDLWYESRIRDIPRFKRRSTLQCLRFDRQRSQAETII